MLPIKLPSGALRMLVITVDNRSSQINKEKIAVSPYKISTRKIKSYPAHGLGSRAGSTCTLADILSGVKGLNGGVEYGENGVFALVKHCRQPKLWHRQVAKNQI